MDTHINLTDDGIKLYHMMQEQYVTDVYLYSGCCPYECLRQLGYSRNTIHELLDHGLIQRRNCDDYALELTAAERWKLIQEHNLGQLWESTIYGRAFHPTAPTGEISMVKKELTQNL